MKPADSQEPESNRRLGGRGVIRSMIMWFVLLVIAPLGVVIGLEWCLRAAGVGTPTTFFVERTLEGESFLLTNRDFYQQFFTSPIGKHWEGSEWAITREKDERCLRVFVFGGSAAQGWPDPDYSFWRILQVMLERAYPDMDVHVYSTAHPGVNSHVMHLAASACGDLQPDLFVVYLGNNEANGPFGAMYLDTDTTPEAVLKQTRRGHFLAQLRFLQLLQHTEMKPMRGEMMGDQVLPAGDPRLAVMSAVFAENLGKICAAGQASGAAVVLSTVGVNLRSCWPHTPVHTPPMTEEELASWQAAFEEGKHHEAESAWAAAQEAYARALAISEGHAELQFRLGNVAYARGDFGAATRHYEAACELDAFRWRAFSAMNEPIRAVATEAGVALAEAKAALAAASPHGVPGTEFFVDNCHLTFSGNYVVAREILRAAGPALEARLDRPPVNDVPSEAECRNLLAFAPAIERDHLMMVLKTAKQWRWRLDPAIDAHWRDVEAKVSEDWLGQNAESFRAALHQRPHDARLRARYAETLLAMGLVEQARVEAERLVAARPHDRRALRLLADVLANAGAWEEAEQTVAKVLQVAPTDAAAMTILGRAKAATGDDVAARRWLEEAIATDPAEAEARALLAHLHDERGDHEGARRVLTEGLAHTPEAHVIYEQLALLQQESQVPAVTFWEAVARDHPEAGRAHFNLGEAYLAAGQLEEARAAFARADEHKGLDAAVLAAWAETLRLQGKPSEAVAKAEALTQLRPGNIESLHLLARCLSEGGRREDALAVLQEAREIAPENARTLEMLGQLHTDLGDTDASLQTLEQAIAADPTSSGAWRALVEHHRRAGDEQQAVETLKAGLEATQHPDELMGTAQALLPEEKSARAQIPFWREIVRVAPQAAHGWRLLAQAHAAAGDGEAAFDAIAQAAELAPDDAAIMHAWADALLLHGRPAEARDIARDLASLRPKELQSSHLLARCASAMGDHKQAVAILEEALTREPADAETLALLGRYHLEAGNIDEAGERLTEALGASPSLEDARLSLAELLAGQGEIDAAIVTLRAGLEQPGPTFLLVDTLRDLVQQDHAATEQLAFWEETAEEHPGIGRVWFVLAESRRVAGNYAGAAEAYARSAETMADDPAVLMGWAQALAGQQRLDEALEKVEHALVINPQIAPAHAIRVRLLEQEGRADEAAAARRHATELGIALPP